MATDLVPKSSKKFHCNYCDYYASRKSQYDRHLLTQKHEWQQKSTNGNQKVQKSSEQFECKCGKIYKDRTGLWRHKKKCKIKEQTDSEENIINETVFDKDLIMMLVKQNSELLEVIKNGTYNTNNSHNHTNSHNKTFNLQFFLNETCKDAMNIMDFVESIQLQISDLESVGKLGFVEGISNIITSNLKALDITQRPVHCTDKKRETIYIKDEDKWEKEDDEKKKIRKAIKRVVTKNICLLPKFKEAYPDCSKSSSKYSDQYNKIIVESCGGPGDNDLEKEDKIIRNIAKNVIIEKE